MSSWPVQGGFFQVFNALYGQLRKKSNILQVHDQLCRLQCVSLKEAKNQEISSVDLYVELFPKNHSEGSLKTRVCLRIVSDDVERVVEYVEKVFSSKGERLDDYDKAAFDSLTEKLALDSSEKNPEPRQEVLAPTTRKSGNKPIKSFRWADETPGGGPLVQEREIQRMTSMDTQ